MVERTVDGPTGCCSSTTLENTREKGMVSTPYSFFIATGSTKSGRTALPDSHKRGLFSLMRTPFFMGIFPLLLMSIVIIAASRVQQTKLFLMAE